MNTHVWHATLGPDRETARERVVTNMLDRGIHMRKGARGYLLRGTKRRGKIQAEIGGRGGALVPEAAVKQQQQQMQAAADCRQN